MEILKRLEMTAFAFFHYVRSLCSFVYNVFLSCEKFIRPVKNERNRLWIIKIEFKQFWNVCFCFCSFVLKMLSFFLFSEQFGRPLFFFLDIAIVHEKLCPFTKAMPFSTRDACSGPLIFNLNWTTAKQETCSPREWHRLCDQHQDLNGN